MSNVQVDKLGYVKNNLSQYFSNKSQISKPKYQINLKFKYSNSKHRQRLSNLFWNFR